VRGGKRGRAIMEDREDTPANYRKYIERGWVAEDPSTVPAEWMSASMSTDPRTASDVTAPAAVGMLMLVRFVEQFSRAEVLVRLRVGSGARDFRLVRGPVILVSDGPKVLSLSRRASPTGAGQSARWRVHQRAFPSETRLPFAGPLPGFLTDRALAVHSAADPPHKWLCPVDLCTSEVPREDSQLMRALPLAIAERITCWSHVRSSRLSPTPCVAFGTADAQLLVVRDGAGPVCFELPFAPRAIAVASEAGGELWAILYSDTCCTCQISELCSAPTALSRGGAATHSLALLSEVSGDPPTASRPPAHGLIRTTP
jgi:hypothetical protein